MEKKPNVIKDKSFEFAVRIVNLYKFLAFQKSEFVLSKQLLKSGTSIGANIEEALGSQSNKEFISKLHISYREAKESLYWLKLLYKTDFINEKEFISLSKDCEELIMIIVSIIKSSKQKIYFLIT